MEKFVVFLMTVAMTFLTTALLTVPYISFSEIATLTSVYQLGLLFGAMLTIGWVYTIYLWKD